MNLSKLLTSMEKRKEYHKTFKIKHITSERQFWNDFKLIKGCSVCGYNKCAEALDFHHIKEDDKVRCISKMIGSATMRKKVMYEVNKCIVICANCHRELHANQ